MILINLLPEEFIERKIQLLIPLKEVAVGLLTVLAIGWGFFSIRYQHLKKQLTSVEVELTAINPDLLRANNLIQEMSQEIMPRKLFLDRLARPEGQWDRILNIVSDVLPEGMWLSSLSMTEVAEMTMRIEGYATPTSAQSAISLVGEFVSRAKKGLDDFLAAVARASATARDLAGSIPPVGAAGAPGGFRADTFTQQQETQSGAITQFIVEFRRR